jgi:hypothetical protein
MSQQEFGGRGQHGGTGQMPQGRGGRPGGAQMMPGGPGQRVPNGPQTQSPTTQPGAVAPN